MLPVIGALRPCADPVITSMGRMPMASPSPPHASIAEARAADPYDTSPTPWAKSLDGRWKFRLFDHPDNVPATAMTRPADGRRWTKLVVPGNWNVHHAVDQNGSAAISQDLGSSPAAMVTSKFADVLGRV